MLKYIVVFALFLLSFLPVTVISFFGVSLAHFSFDVDLDLGFSSLFEHSSWNTPIDESTETLFQMAEQGNADAQYKLGLRFAEGKGVAKDDSEAVKWYRKAAEQGHAEAQNRLGVCYAEGIGVEKDKNEAEKWFRKAAEQGSAVKAL